MNKSVLVDTDIMVDFLRGHKKAVAFIKANSDRMILSALVVAELYAGVKGDQEMDVLDELCSAFRVIPIDSELARAGGLFKRDYGKSRGVGLADSIIAATAQSEGADLKTLNVKHYPMFKGLRPPYTKS